MTLTFSRVAKNAMSHVKQRAKQMKWYGKKRRKLNEEKEKLSPKMQEKPLHAEEFFSTTMDEWKRNIVERMRMNLDEYIMLL